MQKFINIKILYVSKWQKPLQLISRKILVIENLWNFRTVLCNFSIICSGILFSEPSKRVISSVIDTQHHQNLQPPQQQQHALRIPSPNLLNNGTAEFSSKIHDTDLSSLIRNFYCGNSTVWKLSNFPATLILREINFGWVDRV